MEQIKPSLSRKRVMLVEDEKPVRDALTEVLEIHGYDVIDAGNGQEALEKLRRMTPPDIIILDLRMPVMDGWEFRMRQKTEVAFADTPVVAISADDTPQAAAIDADRFLSKPLDPQELLVILKEVVQTTEEGRDKDLKIALSQAERMASLGTLAAGAAHEINNPLAYVISNLGYVSQEIKRIQQTCAPFSAAGGPVPPAGMIGEIQTRLSELSEALDQSKEGADRVRVIVQGLKNFSRGEDQAEGPIRMEDILESSIKMSWNEIRHRADFFREYQTVPMVNANGYRLGQVFLNLLINAAQSIPEGGSVGHFVKVIIRQDVNRQVVCEIQDSGSGVPAHLLSRIFDPFFTTKPIGVGTGLGLSVCHGIVSSLGGRLEVESEEGRGSTFRVSLPPSEALLGETTAPLFPAKMSANARPLIAKIMVIDDEPMIGMAVRRLLGEYEVHDFTAATEALKRFQEGEWFDVVLCDLMMPQMSGAELFAAIKEISAEQSERMIFFTGGAFTDRAQSFLSRVSNRRIDKPFDADELTRMIRGLLENTQQ